MRVSTLSFMAAAHVASAQFMNTTTTATPSATSSSQGVAPTSPASIGPFQKYGCASLENGLSGLDIAATSNEMTLELCASTCFEITGTPGFGVIGATCYCGTPGTPIRLPLVSESNCNFPCPGDETQACGGNGGLPTGAARLRRQGLSFISVFIDPNADDVSTTSAAASATSTPGSGDVNIDIDVVINCYGDYCINIDNSQQNCVGDGCQNYHVVCQGDNCEAQVCVDNVNCDQLVVCQGSECNFRACKGDQCNQKIECIGSICNITNEPRKIVCKDDSCKPEMCIEDCGRKVICSGDDCKTEKPCGCPVPKPPPAQTTVKPTVKPTAQPTAQPPAKETTVPAGKPATPSKPATPATPGKPAAPANPGKPAAPATPEQPAAPAAPGKPAAPATP
ncbi:Cell surface glycoprotein-like protein, partial [Emericellopsis cladophorae]